MCQADQILRQAGIYKQPRSGGARAPLTADSSPVRVLRSPSSKPEPRNPRVLSSVTQKEWPDPILDLERVIGFSSGATETLLWLPDGSAFVYASYSTIITRYVGDRAAANQLADVSDQEFLLGHSGSITAMALTEDGSVLASAEARIDVNPCSIRVWDLALRECLVVVRAHAREVHSVCFSPETAQCQGLLLCGVGFDDNGRTQILVWDCSELRRGISTAGKTASRSRRAAVTMIARQTSDFPVKSIAFSPYEHEFPCLVSCGRENIRYWRVARSGHIVGHPVILKEYSRGTVFNALGFDPLCESFPSDMRRLRPVYAASSVGTLLAIDYDSREVVCVYQLHDASINCLVINEGFCVTGSDDRVLRVWPLDFTDFFLEAHHDAAVTAADVSNDGMKVLVGSRNSAVGVLDISSQIYKTVLRSHAQSIVASALLPWCASSIDQAIGRRKDEFLTGSADGTLRIWDVRSGDQLYEFDVQHDQVTCVEPAPVDQGIVAVGFASGCCRIFDVRQLTDAEDDSLTSEVSGVVVAEIQQHKSAILHLKFTSNGSSLYSSGSGKQLCLYNVTPQREFVPVKMLLVDFNALDGRLSVSRDNKYLAAITGNARGALLLQCDSLRLHCTVTPPKPTSSAKSATELKLAVFCFDQLLLLSKTDRLHIYAMGSRQFVRTMPLLGQDGCVTAIATSVNLKYMATGGADGSLCVWQMDASGKVERLFQSFLGQTGAVTQLAFTAGGERLLATSESSTAFVWRFLGDTSTPPPHQPVSYLLPFGSPATKAIGDDEKENRELASNQQEDREPGAHIEAAGGEKPSNDVNPPSALDSGRPDEAMSPSLDVPIPSLKPHLHLALAQDALVFKSTSSVTSVARTIDNYEKEFAAPTSVMQIATDQRVVLKLSGMISGFSPSHVAWSFALGKLLYVMGPTLWVEHLGTASMDVREGGVAPTSSASSDVDGEVSAASSHSQQEIALLQLAPSGGRAATVPSSYDHIDIHCLHEADNHDEPSCRCSPETAHKVGLMPDTDCVHALAFSSGPETDEALICFSSTVNGASQYFVSVADLSSGAILLSKETSELPSPVDTILPLTSQDRFVLFSPGDLGGATGGSTASGSRLLALNVSFYGGEFRGARLEVVAERFPLDVKCVALSQDTSQDDPRYQRYLVGIDKDSYCCFFDLKANAFIATTQLLPASTRPRASGEKSKLSNVNVMSWSGSKSKQSLIVTGSSQEPFICVHALPMKSTKFSARAQIDWQRVARSGVSLTHAINPQGGAVRSLSIDRNRGVGVVTTSDASVFIVNFDAPTTGGASKVLRRVEHTSKLPPRSQNLAEEQKREGGSFSAMHVADIGWAVQDSLLLSRSSGSGSLRAWLPDVAREVVRFDVASAIATATCTCFTVNSFSPLAMAGYDDNTLRLIDVCTGRVVAHFQLALERHSVASPTDRAEQTRALRTLRQRERLRSSSPAKRPTASSAGGEHRTLPTLKQLEFVGQSSTALAVTSDQRLIWIDYSSVITNNEGSPAAGSRSWASKREKAGSFKAATSEIVYQEIALSESKLRRQPRAVSVAIESIDVCVDTPVNTGAPATSTSSVRVRKTGANAAFLVVLRVGHTDGRTSFLVKVYADPSMRMLSEDVVLPSDEWRAVPASEQPPVALFLPSTDTSSSSVRVLYSTSSSMSYLGDIGGHESDMDDADVQALGWCLEIRDCRERTVLHRLVIGDSPLFPSSIAAPVRMAMAPNAIGRRIVCSAVSASELVLSVDAEGRMALMDLKRLLVIPINTHVARMLKLRLLSSKAVGQTHGKLVLCSSSASRTADTAQDGVELGRVVIGELALART